MKSVLSYMVYDLKSTSLFQQFAELFLEGNPLFLKSSPSDIEDMRKSISRKLFEASSIQQVENTIEAETALSSPELNPRTLRCPVPKVCNIFC